MLQSKQIKRIIGSHGIMGMWWINENRNCRLVLYDGKNMAWGKGSSFMNLWKETTGQCFVRNDFILHRPNLWNQYLASNILPEASNLRETMWLLYGWKIKYFLKVQDFDHSTIVIISVLSSLHLFLIVTSVTPAISAKYLWVLVSSPYIWQIR